MSTEYASTATIPISQAGLPPIGHLEAYISAVKLLPILSPAEETDLAKRFRIKNDLNAAKELVLSHLRLVVSIARQYLGYGLPHADLIQEGNIGLMKAVKRFDPTRGVRLMSFALYWIKAEIQEYVLKNWRILKIASTQAQRKLFFKLRSHKKSFRALTSQQVIEIADTLSVSEQDVLEMEKRMTCQELSIDTEDSGEELDDYLSPINWLSAPHSEPAHILEVAEQNRLETEGISFALSALDNRSRCIMEARWLQDDPEKILTRNQLAQDFGVSAERIRQIETRALQIMKEKILEYKKNYKGRSKKTEQMN